MMKGTRVRVKPWPNIQNTLNNNPSSTRDGYHKNHKIMNFTKSMKNFCNKETRIEGVRKSKDGSYKLYVLEGCDGWFWHEDWFYDMTIKNILPDEVFEI